MKTAEKYLHRGAIPSSKLRLWLTQIYVRIGWFIILLLQLYICSLMLKKCLKLGFEISESVEKRKVCSKHSMCRVWRILIYIYGRRQGRQFGPSLYWNVYSSHRVNCYHIAHFLLKNISPSRTHYNRAWTSSSTWTEHSFEKFQNAIFLKIFEIPSIRVLK